MCPKSGELDFGDARSLSSRRWSPDSGSPPSFLPRTHEFVALPSPDQLSVASAVGFDEASASFRRPALRPSPIRNLRWAVQTLRRRKLQEEEESAAGGTGQTATWGVRLLGLPSWPGGRRRWEEELIRPDSALPPDFLFPFPFLCLSSYSFETEYRVERHCLGGGASTTKPVHGEKPKTRTRGEEEEAEEVAEEVGPDRG